ncbi:hypothetical protein [Aurantiacibacter gangjinensis]|uniref:hypothetical protein n=1 Tax=Aurantiacibacter gangjinensis TaxID=502682 RepID=UPI000909BCDF|nr:hypothetical protein [Aurantiacibacter gangjinensis]APE26887.1 hypothetical protein BMF35_a0058 [Aurantiacibacter gangjinensis]
MRAARDYRIGLGTPSTPGSWSAQSPGTAFARCVQAGYMATRLMVDAARYPDRRAEAERDLAALL